MRWAQEILHFEHFQLDKTASHVIFLVRICAELYLKEAIIGCAEIVNQL